MFRPGMGVASPSYSLSTPAMILSRVDLPEPFRPSMPILAPGKKDREMSFRICRFGGTILPTRFIVKTYWAMGLLFPGNAVQPSIIGASASAAPPSGFARALSLAVQAVLQGGLGDLVQCLVDHVA